MWRQLALVAASTSILAACAPATPATDPDDGWVDEGNVEDGAFDAPGRPKNFIEVDPAHTSSSFRQYVNGALRILATHDTAIGRLTWESIKAGRVQIDEVSDLTCSDFERVLNDFKDSDLGLTESDFFHLHDADSTARDKLTSAIYGYQWSNRIYVTRFQSAEQLASTLVHETNHVLNHSETPYYDDVPTSSFVEEYRAFQAERTFRPEHWAGVNLIDYVCDNYGWDRSAIAPAVLAHPLSPELLPSEAIWEQRAPDAVEDEAACLAQLEGE
jgi:hypothetical protein